LYSYGNTVAAGPVIDSVIIYRKILEGAKVKT
jgi:hypothetical protein